MFVNPYTGLLVLKYMTPMLFSGPHIHPKDNVLQPVLMNLQLLRNLRKE